jgi:uncharacterized protein (TIRG00374 family)
MGRYEITERIYHCKSIRSKVSRHKRLIKIAIIILVIALSSLGAWKSFSSHNFASFLVDLKKLLSQTDLLLFSLAVFVYLVSIPMNVLSWNAILKMFHSGVSVFQLMPILMSGVFFNNVTPMSRTGGELVRAYGLRERFKLPYTIAILSVALCRLTEMVPIVLMGIMGIFALLQNHVVTWQQLGIAGLTGCVVVGTAAWSNHKKHWICNLWSRLLGYFLRKEQRHSGEKIDMEGIAWSVKQKRGFIESLMFSLIVWILALARLKLLAYALGIELSLSAVAAAIVWYTVIGVFAFTPGGIGMVEGGLVAAFMLMGVPASQAFALAVLERGISYLLATAIGAFCAFAMGGRQFLWKSKTQED